MPTLTPATVQRLCALGVRQTHLAQVLGLHPSRLNRWLREDGAGPDLPRGVDERFARYLEALQHAAHALAAAVETATQQHEPVEDVAMPDRVVSDRVVRCPICQTPLVMRLARVTCPACGHQPLIPIEPLPPFTDPPARARSRRARRSPEETTMPALTPEDRASLLGPLADPCPDCGQVRVRHYCRSCDVFFVLCGCTTCSDYRPDANGECQTCDGLADEHTHEGHRVYLWGPDGITALPDFDEPPGGPPSDPPRGRD